jgi:hypothetical protein
MARQQITIPKNLECSICRANDPHRVWKQYVTRKEAVGEEMNKGKGAVVVKIGEWLLLTRWDNLAKAKQAVSPVANEPTKLDSRDRQRRLDF